MNATSYYLIASVVGFFFFFLLMFIVHYERIRKKASKKILSMLTRKEIRGRDLRQNLAKDGLRVSNDLFCFTMNKLVEEGKVERRDAIDSLWYRLPLTAEERGSEAAAHVAHLDR